MTREESTIKAAISTGRTILIHKEAGKLRENCVFAEKAEQVPTFLLEDGACEVNPDGSLTLYAVECPATRTFPVYICWEKVSEENKGKVPGEYGCWSKDNGATTLKLINGKCYNLAPVCQASLMLDDQFPPDFVMDAGFPVKRNGSTWELTRTDWGGEVRRGEIGKAFWVQYGEKDVNILAVDEESAKEYIVQTTDGKDIDRLVKLL